MFNPYQFAQNLKRSTLTIKEQNALISLLSQLSNDDIDEIGALLEYDVAQQKNLFDMAELKVDIIQKSFQKKSDRLRKKLYKNPNGDGK